MPTLDNRWPDEKWPNRIWLFFNVFSVDHQHKEYLLCLLRIQLLERKEKASKQTNKQEFSYLSPGSEWPNPNLWGKTQESVFLPKPYQILWEVLCINLSGLLLTGEEQESTIREEEKHRELTRSLVDSLRTADFMDTVHYCTWLHISLGDCMRKTDVRRARRGEDAGCRNLLY